MSADTGSNPFRPDGELSREAENILKNSTILRDKVIINDPSVKPSQNGISHSPNGSQPLLKSESISKDCSNPPTYEGSPIRTGEVVSGQVPLSATDGLAASEDQNPLQVEHVKIKSGPTNCCSVL
uniref:ZM domain-containing protein n=1 Tax=Mesocestoides corti TaxID=53468 RepID=A0A5K3FPR7_MESCO